MKHFEIIVTGKTGIFDPAGETAKNALLNLGYSDIESLSIGKYIEISVGDDVSDEEVREMCEKLLANPVIEDFRIKEIEGTETSATTQVQSSPQAQPQSSPQASSQAQPQSPQAQTSPSQTEA